MAYIDKIHLSKYDIPKFYEYLGSIDDDFKSYFPNAGSILDYTYFDSHKTYDVLNDFPDETDIPVSNFPGIIDRWLAHREDLPDFIREQLDFQYGGAYSKNFSNSSIFSEPIYNESKEELSNKFRIVSWTKCLGRRYTKAYSKWIIHSITPDYWRYYNDISRFVKDGNETPDLLGYDYYMGSYAIEKNFKSIKSIFRFLRNHGFPKGTKIKIVDFRYCISEIDIEFV